MLYFDLYMKKKEKNYYYEIYKLFFTPGRGYKFEA